MFSVQIIAKLQLQQTICKVSVDGLSKYSVTSHPSNSVSPTCQSPTVFHISLSLSLSLYLSLFPSFSLPLLSLKSSLLFPCSPTLSSPQTSLSLSLSLSLPPSLSPSFSLSLCLPSFIFLCLAWCPFWLALEVPSSVCLTDLCPDISQLRSRQTVITQAFACFSCSYETWFSLSLSLSLSLTHTHTHAHTHTHTAKEYSE